MPLASAFNPEDFCWDSMRGGLDFTCYGITSTYNLPRPAAIRTIAKTISRRSREIRKKHSSAPRLIPGYALFTASARRFSSPRRNSAKCIEKLIAYAQLFRGNPQFLKLTPSGGIAFTRNRATAYRESVYVYDCDLDNQIHYFEPPDAVALQRAKFPRLKESGLIAIGPRRSFGHFIHTTLETVTAVAEAVCNIVRNPLSDGRLASGSAGIPAYLKAGMKVGMGVDNQTASDISDPFENMRMELYPMRDK